MSHRLAAERRKAILADTGFSDTVVAIGDAIFVGRLWRGWNGQWELHYYDTWFNEQPQATHFDSEVEMAKFLGEVLSSAEGPTEEFRKRFPREFSNKEVGHG